MQTVQFDCGNCGKTMAVGIEHLGAQVHCPHCMEIVQAPSAPADSPDAAPALDSPIPEIQVRPPDVEEGSIFSGTNTEDDLFSPQPGPQVEMPAAAVDVPTPAPTRFAIESEPHSSFTTDAQPAETVAFVPEKHWTESAMAAHESELPPQDLSRYKRSRSILWPMVLIFLIPYSLVCTGYIVWTLLHPPNAFDPLELLRDPKPGEGGPRRVAPEAPLPKKLKTSFNQPIRIGDTEVTPLKVVLVNRDLVLHLRMKNLSRDLEYTPLADAFLGYTEKRRPYTFLDTGKDALFGGYVEWLKNGKKDEKKGVLRPGEENVTLLTSNDKHQNQIEALLKSRDEVVWRVQVRRGFVKVDGKDVSATAVIGVTFSPQDIQKADG
jgi:hypothetical protein